MTKLHIDEVCPKGSTYPLITNFLHGNPTDSFQADESLLLKRSTNSSKTLLAKVENLLYIGDEEGDDLNKTFIVKRNKITGKVQIIEAGIVNLKPVINVNTAGIEAMEVSNLELSRKFGSKKARKYLEQRDKLKLNADTVTEQMKNVTQDISQDTLDLSTYDLANSDEFYIPKMDRSALKPEDVYKIEDILSEAQYDKILSELKTKDCTSDFLPFTKSIMAKKSLSEKQNVSLVYADALLRLFITTARDITKKNFVICPHSNTLNTLALANFTSMSNGKRVRSPPFKDRTLCHAIVLLLLLNNLKIDLDSLSEAIKLSPVTCSTKARVTGASIVTVDGKKIIQLKLPLTKSTFRRRSAKF